MRVMVAVIFALVFNRNPPPPYPPPPGHGPWRCGDARDAPPRTRPSRLRLGLDNA